MLISRPPWQASLPLAVAGFLESGVSRFSAFAGRFSPKPSGAIRALQGLERPCSCSAAQDFGPVFQNFILALSVQGQEASLTSAACGSMLPTPPCKIKNSASYSRFHTSPLTLSTVVTSAACGGTHPHHPAKSRPKSWRVQQHATHGFNRHRVHGASGFWPRATQASRASCLPCSRLFPDL